jgi:arsenate reductase
MLTIYGIPNCDTIKKARRWLADNNIEANFHDYRKDGIDRALLESFEANLGWQALLNKRGTTWRQLDEETKNNVDRDSAIALMLEHPAMIKRPVLTDGTRFLVGFAEKDWQAFVA